MATGAAAGGMSGRVWAMLMALAVLWGGSFLFVGIAVRGLPPLSIVALRVGLAAVVLLAVLRLTGRRLPRSGRVLGALLVMGLANNAIPFTLIVWGQTQIASGLAAILNATTPVFGVLLAHWLTAEERLTPARAVGVALGLAGVAVLMGGAALSGLGSALAAQAAVLAAAVSYALAGIWGRRFRALGVEPVVGAAGQVAASTLLIAPLALAVDRPWELALPGAGVWAAVGALALLSTAAAYVLYFRILAAAGATNLLLVTFLIPPWAIGLGWAVLGERLEARHLVGLALIAAGLAAIDGRLARALAARTRRRGGCGLRSGDGRPGRR